MNYDELRQKIIDLKEVENFVDSAEDIINNIKVEVEKLKDENNSLNVTNETYKTDIENKDLEISNLKRINEDLKTTNINLYSRMSEDKDEEEEEEKKDIDMSKIRVADLFI